MSNDNNNSNNTPRLTPQGLPNLEGNPRVLAAFIDLIGTNITSVLNQMKDRAAESGNTALDNDQRKEISNEEILTLIDLQRLLGVMRHAVGFGTDWHEKNLMMEVTALREAKREHDARMAKAIMDLAAASGIPLPEDLQAKVNAALIVPAADAADALLNDLRADGIIG